MKLSELVQHVKGLKQAAAGDPEIRSVIDDSRAAQAGALFVARTGSKAAGAAFIEDAVKRGASALVVSMNDTVPAGIPAWRTANPTAMVAPLAHAFAGFPSKHLKMLGVTGTNGKTTVAFFVQQLMLAAGSKFGLMGTILTDDGKTLAPAELTTPGAAAIAPLLKRMRDNGCKGVAMEVSSHALEQGRVAEIDFEVALFTNLSGDHLDYHGTMAAYGDAKAKLFEGLRGDAIAIVNADDPMHARMLRDCRARVLRCGVAGGTATHVDVEASVLEARIGSMRLRLRGPWGEVSARLPVMGRHNATNALQATAAAWSLGSTRDAIESGLSTIQAPPGRLEPVTALDSPFAVLVDYAHTDDALLNVLRALRPALPTGGRLIAVFGCGGDRDKSKRPRMAAVACEHADLAIITSDNPRTEDPASIVEEVAAGVPAASRGSVMKMVDRREAIMHAVSLARPGDAVLIAGKGHENYQIVGTVKRPFDDRVVAREALGAAECVK
ncbi:MAG: UDP-N-acetylmuramoyl-L-alanyl-D-glutamate--2,6-diaminopimelate ligase [Planctomycetes bacterium]|nr:UDP-N-acetylmuramoyl-L-alanyl-D-glutamate--2,6-diaminopimelate ligase [Planctomycetota bacterium]